MKKDERNSWNMEKQELKKRRRRITNGKDSRDIERR